MWLSLFILGVAAAVVSIEKPAVAEQNAATPPSLLTDSAQESESAGSEARIGVPVQCVMPTTRILPI
jgi:hypothetical protein